MISVYQNDFCGYLRNTVFWRHLILANFKKAKSACILFKRIDAKFVRIYTNSRKKLAKIRATKVFAISRNLLQSLKLSDAKISKRIHNIKTEMKETFCCFFVRTLSPPPPVVWGRGGGEGARMCQSIQTFAYILFLIEHLQS